MRMKRILLAWCVCCTAGLCFSQTMDAVSLMKSISFSRRDFVDTIKVQVEDGAVIVPVEIAGMKKRFLFDTGAAMGVWLGEEEDWMQKTGSDGMDIADINKNVHQKTVYRCPPIRLGHLGIENYPMIAEDAMNDFLCGQFDGLLGFNLVGSGLSFKLDTKDSLLIVTDRKGFFAEEEKGMPMVKYQLAKNLHPLITVKMPLGWVEMLFDTGAMNHWLDLPEHLLERWGEHRPKMEKEVGNLTCSVDTMIGTHIGLYGFMGDTLLARTLHFPEVQVGGLTLKDLYACTNSRTLCLGSALLKRSSVIIDAPRKRFVFLPHHGESTIAVENPNVGSLSFVPSESGDTLGALRAVVRKGSPAYEQGIRTGDYLLEVDGTPIPDICTYRQLGKKDKEVSMKFRAPDGKVKTARLRRSQ